MLPKGQEGSEGSHGEVKGWGSHPRVYERVGKPWWRAGKPFQKAGKGREGLGFHPGGTEESGGPSGRTAKGWDDLQEDCEG